MTFAEAVDMADALLVQERIEPTVSYHSSAPVKAVLVDNRFGQVAPATERNSLYYPVRTSKDSQFSSGTYDLLSVLLGRLPEPERRPFLSCLSDRIAGGEAFTRRNVAVIRAGYSDASSSETPLLAEFLVRQGGTALFLKAFRSAPLTPALTIMLLHLRSMIAWNFTLFTDGELAEIANTAKEQNSKAVKAQHERHPAGDPQLSNTHYNVAREFPAVASAVEEECREARFHYLKGFLSQDMNLEVNQDKIRISDSLARLGFTQELIESLNQVERLYQTANTGFDFKSCLGHLRSFIENLHLQISARVHAERGGTLPARWGETHEYLASNDFLTKQEKLFIIPFYTLLSDAAVHPLQADREYARLLRNISIEYGLLLVTRLDQWLHRKSSS